MLLAPTVLTAQIKPPPKPPAPIITAPPIAPGDLVIDAVTVTDVSTPPPRTLATVTVRNAGARDVTFPAGSVLLRGDAAQSGSIGFQPLSTPTPYTIAAGASVQLTMTVGDVCAAGRPGPVTFRVDPDGMVPERNESNNSRSLPTVGSFANADLQAPDLSLEQAGSPPPPHPGMQQGVSAGSVGDLVVIIVNMGSGEGVLCPGLVLWREVESPVASKYGLRAVNTPGSVTVIAPRQDPNRMAVHAYGARLAGAYQPGDLPPATYTWKVMVNPSGQLHETNTGNNVSTGYAVIK
jgi:hypothetical protein